MTLIKTSIILLLVMLIVVSCTPAEMPTIVEISPTTIPSQTSSLSLPTLTSTPYQVVFPSITMSPQENENALLELLRTNGDCIGKCIGGIYPDEMNVQNAVDVMAKWGAVGLYENPRGSTYITLNQTPLYGQVGVNLSIGTWTKRMETIDYVHFEIRGSPNSDSYYVNEDVWLANQEVFTGFRMDTILKNYGVPSYIGYDFSSLLSPSSLPRKGERFGYGMSLHFEEINMHILLSGMAYYDGEMVFLCPSQEPHALSLEINPERPLKEIENVFSTTWQTLTGTDLNAFYQTFTGENAFDACVTTKLEQILTLQP